MSRSNLIATELKRVIHTHTHKQIIIPCYSVYNICTYSRRSPITNNPDRRRRVAVVRTRFTYFLAAGVRAG